MWTASNVVSSYRQLVRTVVPGPQSLTYFVPLIVLTSCLIASPTHVSSKQIQWIALPIILASTFHGWLRMGGPDVISADTLWWSLFFLLFRNPRRDFRVVVWKNPFINADDKVTGRAINQSAESVQLVDEGCPETFSGRLKWALLLLSNRPLTSWKTGEAVHDAHVLPPNVVRSRKTFVLPIMSVLALSLFVLMPLSLQAHTYDTFFHSAQMQLTKSPEFTSLTPLPLRWLYSMLPFRLIRPLMLIAYIYSLMSILFLPPYLLAVLANYLFRVPSDVWSPHTWPRSHFGPFLSVLDRGLRGFWGGWWHQQMRHAVSEPGRWFANKLGLRRDGRGQFLRYMLICTSAFALSGVTHMGLVPPEPRWADKCSPWLLRLEIACFFWIQPIGILLDTYIIESSIKALGMIINKNRSISQRWAEIIPRVVRFFWVLAWISGSIRFLNDPFIELGYWRIWSEILPMAP